MSAYLADLQTILAALGLVVLNFSPAFIAFAGVASLIKYVSPDRITSRAQKGRNL